MMPSAPDNSEYDCGKQERRRFENESPDVSIKEKSGLRGDARMRALAVLAEHAPESAKHLIASMVEELQADMRQGESKMTPVSNRRESDHG